MSCEVSWFSALSDDDYEFLGVPDAKLKSSWEHCCDIVLGAEAGGFDNVLLPSGFALGIDATAFAAGIAVLTRQIRLLLAVRVEGVRREAELRAGAGRLAPCPWRKRACPSLSRGEGRKGAV